VQGGGVARETKPAAGMSSTPQHVVELDAVEVSK
jgi:hypothetical protein